LLLRTISNIQDKEMKRIKFISKFAAVGTMCVAFTGMIVEVAQAQRRIVPLLSNSCVTTIGYVSINDGEVSIGRQLFTSSVSMQVGPILGYADTDTTSITCRLKSAGSSAKYKSLGLGFGIPDNSNGGEVTVSVYLDGNLVGSRSIYSGENAQKWGINVSSANSISIQASCSNNCPEKVHFYYTGLQPISR
jgi:hypothetical protein